MLHVIIQILIYAKICILQIKIRFMLCGSSYLNNNFVSQNQFAALQDDFIK